MIKDPHQFWIDVCGLTNRFEPLKNFANEQAYFELKKTNMQEAKDDCYNRLSELDIDYQTN